jgi:predicted SprT family Zn-dependent metalloprotease
MKSSILPSSYWASAKFGKLRMKDPISCFPNSGKKYIFICDCGKEKAIIIQNISKGMTTTCGNCSSRPAEYWSNTKFGMLRMKNPVNVKPMSDLMVPWLCDCGQESIKRIKYVVRGDIVNCGRCRLRDASYWAITKFGKLRMKFPIEISEMSNKKVEWICDCGSNSIAFVANVFKGNTRSCGRCYSTISNWFERNQKTIASLKLPIHQHDLPNRGIKLIDPIVKIGKPFRAVCFVCCGVYSPRWSDILRGRSLACVCATNRISKFQRDIFNSIISFGVVAELEYKILNKSYDIGLPDLKAVIECNGEYWHSSQKSLIRDLTKKNIAESSGWSFLSISDTEWSKCRMLSMKKLMEFCHI